jgi:hypothetical protein
MEKTIKLPETVIEPTVNIKVSESKKYANDGQWFKDFMEYVIPYDTSVSENYEEMLASYALLNNDISQYENKLNEFCNDIGEEEFAPNHLKDDPLLPFNRVPNKFNVILGGLAKRNDQLKPILLSDKAIKSKTEAQRSAIRDSIMERAQLQIAITDMQQNGADEEQIQQFTEQYLTQEAPEDLAKKEFLSEWEIFNSKAIKYFYNKANVKSLQQMTMKHSLAAGMMFVHVGWNFGEPSVRVVNPLHAFWHKSPDVKVVQKGDYFGEKRPITVAEVYSHYGELLSKEELSKVLEQAVSSSSLKDKRHDVPGKTAKLMFSTINNDLVNQIGGDDKIHIGQSMAQGSSGKDLRSNLIWETRLVFKAFRDIIVLNYIDDMGEEITEIVDSKYEIPKNAKKVKFTNQYFNPSVKYEWVDSLGVSFSAEKLSIPREYEVIRLGDDVYPIYRETPHQPINLSNPYANFELSYKGGAYDDLNSKVISPIQRAMPFVFQYMQIKRIQLREIAKYQGYTQDIDVDQIPDYFMQDENGDLIPGLDKVAIWSLYLKKLGKNFYSGSQSSDGTLPSTRSPGSKSAMTGTAVDLINLANLLDYVDREIGMAMGVSPQREANFTQGTNVTDNQQAIQQSYDITEPLYQQHSEFWKDVINGWLKLFKIYCRLIFDANPKKKEHFLEYVTPNGTKELFKITPEVLDNEDIGIFLANTGQDQQYRDMMTQMVHAFSQNAGEGVEIVSSMLKSITSGESPEEIHKTIQVEAGKQQARVQQMEQSRLAQEERLTKREDFIREDQQAHEIQLEEMRNQNKLEVKAMDVYKNQEDLNTDNDGIPDPLEALKIIQDADFKNRELNQKDRELDIKDKDVEVKRELGKQAAKNKAKSSDSK